MLNKTQTIPRLEGYQLRFVLLLSLGREERPPFLVYGERTESIALGLGSLTK